MESVRGGGSRSKEATVESGSASSKSVLFWADSREGEEFTMSVTGRMGPGCVSVGVEEFVWSEVGGGGEELGRTFGEITSLMQEEAGSSSWEFFKGASSVED